MTTHNRSARCPPEGLPQREEGLPFSRLEKEPRQLTEPEQIPPQLPGRPVRRLSERPRHSPASRGTSGPSHWTNHLHPQESVGTARVPFAPQLECLGYSFALAVLVKPAPLFQKTVRGQTALPGSYRISPHVYQVRRLPNHTHFTSEIITHNTSNINVSPPPPCRVG